MRAVAEDGDRAEGRRLAERILDAVPVTQLAFLKLIGLLDVRATRAVDTACVTLGARSRLLLNPDFVRERCVTDEALVMLVLHELFHVVLGHTRLYRTVTPAQNWAFDAVINAHLCRLMPDPAYTALFRNTYRPDVFPEAMLRPPPGWGTPSPRWLLEGDAREAHRALYSDLSVTHGELLALLERAEGNGASLEIGRLLGTHGAQADDQVAPDPGVVDALRDIVARWPMVERRSGRDQGGDGERMRLAVAAARGEAVRVIRRALLPLLDLGAGGGGVPWPGRVTVAGVLPYRTVGDRRGAVRAAAGAAPLLHRAEIEAPEVQRFERAHVYVDVSGSMGGVLPVLYGALVPLLPYLHPQVHLFSTVVRDVRPRELRAGVVESSWGTEIDCVTGHILQHRVRRALLVTDGFVGEVPSSHLRALRTGRVRLGAVLTAGGDPTVAAALGARVHTLPPLDP